MTNIYVELDGIEYIVSGDFAKANSPLYIDASQTPYQVADARHRRSIAIAICLDHIGAASFPLCPAGMTPGEWDERLAEYPRWNDVEYRDATDEEVARIETAC